MIPNDGSIPLSTSGRLNKNYSTFSQVSRMKLKKISPKEDPLV